jgi:hypothetical protein
MQMCWVVPDLTVAIESWARSAGVGPFFWIPDTPFTEGTYRGKPADFPAITAAIAYAGDIQIELVRQDDDKPSIFRDLVPPGRSGLHHMALYCGDYEAERDAYLEAGAELAYEGWIAGSRTSWVDTTSTLGFMVELLEPSPGRAAFFTTMRDAAARWDGQQAIVGRDAETA